MCLGKAHETKSCTGTTLLKEHKMKKTIIAILAILIIASVSIFAVDDSFTVTTNVAEIGLMKVSSAAIVANTNTGYTNAGEFLTLPITTSGTQDFSAYLTVLANKRSGYEVTMAATAMTSTVGSATSYINYTVSLVSDPLKKIVTNGATATGSVTVMDVNSLTALTGASEKLALSVDSTTFEAAVSGSYTGTVTFTFSAT